MKFIKKRYIALAITAALNTAPVTADETASAIRGSITGPNGNTLSGVEIQITHVPTGKVTSISSNSSGVFSAKGLKVGGPYIITIASDQYENAELTDIYLKVGETLRLTPQLGVGTQEEVVVIGSANPYGSDSNTFGAQAIQGSPGISRDLKDTLRNNPLVNILPGSDAPMSIAGMNPRYNSFSVDGVRQNDDFGLNSNGYPTQRSPISIEAIEQVHVDATPFSALNGGFSGGQVNAVTKSGTNEFHGSVFYESMSDSLAGETKNPITDEKIEGVEFEETVFGGTLGGPILEDKLFFFTSYESYESTSPALWGPANSGFPNATFATLDSYQRLSEIAKNVYGIDVGSYSAEPEETDDKFLLKVDWNINDDHRLATTYQHTKGNVIRNQTSSQSDLRLSTHWYNNEQTQESLAVSVYSDWSESFTTEVKLAGKKVETIQAPGSKAFGDITVYTSEFNGSPSSAIAFGPDQYRHGNELENETLNFRFVGTWLVEEHELNFGLDYESIDIRNLFAPASLGVWEFDSLEDFENKKASSFDYKNAFSNNVEDAAAKFGFSTLTLFAEDTWNIATNLEISAGLRYESISNSDKPANNQNFSNRYGFSNTENLDGLSILLPRFSFIWDIATNTRLKGGIGRFSGGRPNVWISNAYSNNGVTYTTFDEDAAALDSDYLSNVDISKVPQSVLDNMVAGDGNTNVTDPDFELPSDIRSQIKIEQNFDIPALGNDFLFTGELLYIERENDVQWIDLAREPTGKTSDQGRIIYSTDGSDRYDLMLTNADESGYSAIIATSLAKEWENGLSVTMSYTHQDITEGNPGNSSTATSNYQYVPTINRNETHVGRADYEIEHRFVLNLGYSKAFIGDYDTTINLFMERKSGRPFSWALGSYRDDDLGDQSDLDDSDYYLPYIPNGADDPNVVYNNTSYEEVMSWVNAAGLGQYAGGYAPKNTGSQPWTTRMDLRIEQEIPGFMKGHKGSIFFTVHNLLNLIDNDSGRVLNKEFSNEILVDYDIDDQGRYVYSERFGGFDYSSVNWDQIEVEDSIWKVKIGLRYTF